MKKVLSLTLMALIMFGGYACARNIYDSTGRHLIYDGSIRGRQRAAKQAELQQKAKIEAAAAAKLDYDKLENELKTKPLQSNYIQTKNGATRELTPSKLKSNYIQSPEREF